MIIAGAVRRAVSRRRSRRLFQLATFATVLGALPFLFGPLMGLFFGGSGLGSIIGLLLPAAYTFLVASTVYYRLSGITLR
jgi:4-hydroxybenzoate polyprenyltransferase